MAKSHIESVLLKICKVISWIHCWPDYLFLIHQIVDFINF